MIQVHFKEMAELIGPLYQGKAVAEVVTRLVHPHQYMAFYREQELENIIRSTCYTKGWNEEFVVAVYSDIDLTTSSGFKFGSCLMVPDTTPEQLAMLIERGLRMKAFL